MDVGEAILRRRSVRRFDRSRGVPRELVMRVLDAARFAPSSCNLQTWDFVVVEDAALKQRLSEQTKSVLVAPVNVFVVYDRELAKEGLANVQSASAAIMTMLLKATSLGLASLWVNAIGDHDRVRELLGVPAEYDVLALVCLGYAADAEPPPAPERRPLDEVTHVDRFVSGGQLPRSPDPDAWTLEQIGTYLKRKLQSGTRFNKADPRFVAGVIEAVKTALPGAGEDGTPVLDVLPGTGVFTEALAKAWPRARLAVLESTAENHFFANRRSGNHVAFVPWPAEARAAILARCAPPGAKVQIARESGGLVVMPRILPYPELAEPPFHAATCLFRLEALPSAWRPRLLADVFAQLARGAPFALAFTSRRSWHGPAYALRRRLGRDSVEVAPTPDPNVIGPYEALAPGVVRDLVRAAGFAIRGESALFPLPDVERLRPRVLAAKGAARVLGRVFLVLAAALRPFESLLRPFARIRVLHLVRP
ncbi:MAG: nitroreductase family protein [Planctomycetes bacterium]|nr:nitroreductase family protein [Planctomycetota bacterium]